MKRAPLNRPLVCVLILLATSWLATTLSAESFTNPIISGFSPDPSITRVGDDFYLITSTFEYFPGVPIYHSRDLVHWELINYVLRRPSQLPLRNCESSSGIYAPVLRYHDGTFYMITTNFAADGVFYVTATDPRGEWSEPVWLGNVNVDPSLLFDDDGKVYLIHPDGGEQGQIFLREMDLANGTYKAEPPHPGKFLWMGTGGAWPEGPHLYKIEDYYYLMMAEGGTGQGHRETIARSKSPWGPYWPWEENPIMTHRDVPDHPIMATGHADMFQIQDGSWWAVFLGVRQKDQKSHLGRESFLTSVTWTDDGWPVFGKDRRVPMVMAGPDLPRSAPEAPPVRDSFNAPKLGLEWNYVRNPVMERYSLSARPGWLRLQGVAATFNDLASPTALLRRQRHFDVSFSTLLDFEPTRNGDEAGLSLRLNEEFHVELGVAQQDGKRRIFLRQTFGGDESVHHLADLGSGPVELRARADRDSYWLSYKAGENVVQAGRIATDDLSPEASWGKGIRCFTGVMIGVYATGNGATASAPADFDYFDYAPHRL